MCELEFQLHSRAKKRENSEGFRGALRTVPGWRGGESERELLGGQSGGLFG